MNVREIDVKVPEGAPRLESHVGTVLRTGTLISVACLVAGTALSFFNHPDYFWSADALARLTAPENTPHRLSDVLTGIAGARGRAITMVGILLLIALPILRLAGAWAMFRKQGDRIFSQLCLFLLGLLMIAFLLGAEG